MYKLRFTLLLLFFSYASGELANKPDDIKTPTTTSVTGTPNAKDNASTTAKSKTEKRDSANQTGTPAVHRIQDEPFRPIYAPGQYQQEASASAPAAAVNAAFQPTTVRYMAVEAVPQAYYEKAQTAAGLGGRGGIHYASSAYRGPFNPSYQSLPQLQPQPEQQQQQQQQQLPREQQQQQPHRQQHHFYAYAEPDAHYTHESETPQPQQQYQQQQLHHQQQQQQYQQQLHQYAQQQLYAYYALQKQQRQQQQQQQHSQQRSPSAPSPSPSPSPPPPPPPAALQRPPHTHAPQQQVHYVIAIPLSYMRQLQQQLVSAHEAPLGYGQPTPTVHAQPHARPLARPQPLVLVQPIAREQLAYQPPPPPPQPLLQYSTADAAPPPAAPAAYNTQLIQLPANLLFAAGRLPPAGYHLHRSPVFQPFFYGQPQHVRQQQLQQQPEPYAQQQPLPAPYQHSQQQQKQKHQQQKQPQVVRIGGTKSTAKLIATPSPSLAPPVASTAATAPHITPQAAAALSPIVHYNPAYVQAPPPPPAAEQPAGAILNYAPFVQGQYGGMPQATLVKLSAPSALVAPSPHHYYTLPHHPLAAPKLTAYPMAAASAAAPSSYIVRANHYEPGAALRLPFFQQAGGVHYGTHLYHPPTPTTPSKAAANGPQQQQQQSAAAGGAADDSANIVKYP